MRVSATVLSVVMTLAAALPLTSLAQEPIVTDWFDRFEDDAELSRHPVLSGETSVPEEWLVDIQSTRRMRRNPGPSASRLTPDGQRPVQIPEPLLFDMVRPLGPRTGDLEFNTLAVFPWRRRGLTGPRDPFGSGTATTDRGEIEWAPEVEVALSETFAIEFELPFEGGTLEELKLGLQWTFGTALDNQYIHGMQILLEPTPQFETWNSTLVYIGGFRFDETWSTLFMVGGRMDLEGPDNFETFERLVNASLFAEVVDWLTLGVEVNVATALRGRNNYIMVPQSHIQLTDTLELQAGIGLGAAHDGYELSGIIRGIWARE